MTVVAEQPVLRPKSAFSKWLGTRLFSLIPYGFAFLRRFKPIPRFGGTIITTRYDDVQEIFANDSAFGVPYWPKLQVITGGEPFFLGMGDGSDYREGLQAMHDATLPADLPLLAQRVEDLAAQAVKDSNGELEVVQFVRDVTFEYLAAYFGVPDPDGCLQMWATRLFEFQFVDPKDDPALRKEVDEFGPALRAHVDQEIKRRKQLTDFGDDVLGRCLIRQKDGHKGYADSQIRTSIVCMIVGGPPQPPMVVPQALEQLLRRPEQLEAAQTAAGAGDDELLHDLIFEAMRFDPLAPGLPRVSLAPTVIAKGTPRETKIAKGATVIAGLASAMMDPRRVPNPRNFDATRTPDQYMHFGHGLHECFGRHINHATLHRMLKPLLQQRDLRRASGGRGRLLKNGPFADRLCVQFASS